MSIYNRSKKIASDSIEQKSIGHITGPPFKKISIIGSHRYKLFIIATI